MTKPTDRDSLAAHKRRSGIIPSPGDEDVLVVPTKPDGPSPDGKRLTITITGRGEPKERPLNPQPPSNYSDAEKEAWLRGYQSGLVEGQDSIHEYCPYAGIDGEEHLEEAWMAGEEAAEL